MLKPVLANSTGASSSTTGEDKSNSVVCIANIGPEQQRKRLRFGLATFAIGVVIAALLIFFRVDSLWRISLILPFYLGAIGFFQARDKT